MLSVNTNSSAIGAMRWLSQSNSALAKSLARLSSGSRITSPEDDAAGLAQSIRLNNESIRDQAAITDLQNNVSYFQTKDGYLQKAQKAFDRMSELSVLALDSTKTDADRENYDKEFQALKAQVGQISNQTFNGKNLFKRYEVVEFGSSVTWTASKADAESKGGHLATITSAEEMAAITGQLSSLSDNVWIGATDEAVEGSFQWVTGEAFSYSNWDAGEPNNSLGIEDYAHMYASTLLWNDYPDSIPQVTAYLLEKEETDNILTDGDGNTFSTSTDWLPSVIGSIDTASNAKQALSGVKSAITELARQRANAGATITRLKSHIDELSTRTQNLDSSVSRISDVDVATESTRFARQSILVQSGTAMLAQANALPQNILRLLG